MGFNDLDAERQSDFLKLTAGAPTTVKILTKDPKKESVHWVDKKKSTCLVNACENCMAGNKPKPRWTIDVWDRKDQAVKKFEFGSMIASQLKSIAEMMAESQKTIHDTDIRIKTTGSGIDTEYSVLHVPSVGDIPAEILEKYGHVPF